MLKVRNISKQIPFCVPFESINNENEKKIDFEHFIIFCENAWRHLFLLWKVLFSFAQLSWRYQSSCRLLLRQPFCKSSKKTFAAEIVVLAQTMRFTDHPTAWSSKSSSGCKGWTTLRSWDPFVDLMTLLTKVPWWLAEISGTKITITLLLTEQINIKALWFYKILIKYNTGCSTGCWEWLLGEVPGKGIRPGGIRRLSKCTLLFVIMFAGG